MARVFLMSPPPPGWRILGGANYKSEARPAVNPRKALWEWLALADAIAARGGEIAVLPPAPSEPPLTGLIYTANAGWLLGPGQFRVSRLSVAHRQAEGAHLVAALRGIFGFEAIAQSRTVWEGQADMCSLSAGSLILSYGVRSVAESVAEVRASLPAAVRVHAARLRQPYFHGDTCMDAVEGPRGKLWLVHPGAFATEAEYRATRAFAEAEAEVIEISEADALGYACNALSLGSSLLAPTGLSAPLLRTLADRGVEVDSLDFGELFGKGGGGPRCLVNELRGLTTFDHPSNYRRMREALVASAERYPTSA